MPGDWSRPRWKPSGQDASLFYFVAVEAPPQNLTISPQRHHVNAEGDWQDRVRLSTQRRSDNAKWFGYFFDPKTLGHDLDRRFGDRAAILRQAEWAAVVEAELPDPPSLDYLRNCHGMVSALLEQGGLGVYELFHSRWWAPEEWVRCFVERCEFHIGDHVQIALTEDEAAERHRPGRWLHTRGMRKFGRPDLQIKHIVGCDGAGEAPLRAAATVLKDFAERMARGEILPAGLAMRYAGNENAFAFVATPDEPSVRSHFNNSVLEIVDYDPVAGAGQGLNRLLAELVAGENKS